MSPDKAEKLEILRRWKRRYKVLVTGWARWVFNRPCRESFCNEHRRCWRWHVERATCPTCHREMDEFEPGFLRWVFERPANRSTAVTYNYEHGTTEPMATNG